MIFGISSNTVFFGNVGLQPEENLNLRGQEILTVFRALLTHKSRYLLFVNDKQIYHYYSDTPEAVPKKNLL